MKKVVIKSVEYSATNGRRGQIVSIGKYDFLVPFEECARRAWSSSNGLPIKRADKLIAHIKSWWLAKIRSLFAQTITRSNP